MKQLLCTLFFIFGLTASAQAEFSLYFDFGKDVPNNRSLNEFDEWRTNNKKVVIEAIKGYTDSTGSASYNMALSLCRA